MRDRRRACLHWRSGIPRCGHPFPVKYSRHSFRRNCKTKTGKALAAGPRALLMMPLQRLLLSSTGCRAALGRTNQKQSKHLQALHTRCTTVSYSCLSFGRWSARETPEFSGVFTTPSVELKRRERPRPATSAQGQNTLTVSRRNAFEELTFPC